MNNEINSIIHNADACISGCAASQREMEVDIPYGHGFQTLHLPEEVITAVLKPERLLDIDMSDNAQSSRVDFALANPIGSPRLSDLAKDKKHVLVITSDHTRPVPSKITIPKMLAEIRSGNPNAEIIILIATGMHRKSTQEEIVNKLGASIAENECIECHDSSDVSNLIDMGVLPSGGRLVLNARVAWADLIVSDGFIEPHFFAGFSGGRKSVLPGIAGEETVCYNHNGEFIQNTNSRQGVLTDNPVHKDMLFAARKAGLKFILNVIINSDKKIISAFAGDLEKAHAAGCEACVLLTRVKKVEADIVVTSNGGYPLDQNIYQSVKGMTAAEACVKPNGFIIMASECSDGVGGDNFLRIISEADSPAELLEKAAKADKANTPADQWQAQIFARVLSRAKVYYVTNSKNRQVVESMGMTFASSCDWAVRDALAKKPYAKVVVIPDGVGVIVGG